MPERLTEDQLSAIISQQIELAKSHDKSVRATPREKALDYYFGNMDAYVPPEANRSRVVSRDVADTISRMLPGIMRVFASINRMFIAEPVGTEDAETAQVASDGLNYVFWKDNKGYETVYDATWDALLNANGIIKTFYDDTPVYTTSFHSGLTDDQLALLVQDDGIEVLQKTDRIDQIEVEGQVVQLPVCDVKIRRKMMDGKFVVTAIPNEEFLIDSDAIHTDEAAFTDHRQRKSRSALVGMGYDKDKVWSIPEAARNDTPEETARRMFMSVDAADKSMQLVDYHECFIRIDVDDDGEAELVRACCGGPAGEVLLDWEVWEDENPFDDIRCEPIPHRFEARSVADETIDVQDVKTVLTRQFLNGTYWANNPQRFVAGKVRNPEQLDHPTFGGTVFGDAGTTITNLTIDNVGETALAGLSYMDEVRQSRTGVSRQTMALDPEALQNQTAEAVRDGKDAAYSQVELVARNMAEYGGWSNVGRKLLRLMVKHQEQPRKVMLNSKKEVTIDPRYWNADMNVTINTGIGTGSRERDMAMLGRTLQNQLLLAERLMMAGDTEDAIDMLPKIVTTMTKMDESAGIQNAEDFYPEFTKERIEALKQAAAQPKPNPKLEEIAATGEVQKGLKEVDAQVSMHEAQLKAQGEVVKNQAELDADLTTKEADRQNALAIEAMKQQGAERIEMMRIASAERLKQMDLQHQAQQAEATRNNAVQIAAMKPKPEPAGKAAN